MARDRFGLTLATVVALALSGCAGGKAPDDGYERRFADAGDGLPKGDGPGDSMDDGRDDQDDLGGDTNPYADAGPADDGYGNPDEDPGEDAGVPDSGAGCIDCGGGDDSGDGGDDTGDPINENWDFTIDSAVIHKNGHQDFTTASDPKAKVTTADGAHEETSTLYDNLMPAWEAELFTDKAGTSLTAVTIDIDDYDRASGDDDIGECYFNVDDGHFHSGEAFTLTESCDDIFDVTFTIRPSSGG